MGSNFQPFVPKTAIQLPFTPGLGVDDVPSENVQEAIEYINGRFSDFMPLPVMAYCYSNIGQAIGTGANTVIDFNTVVLDTLSGVTTGAAWSYTGKVNGWYEVTSSLLFDPSTEFSPVEYAEMQIRINEATVAPLDFKTQYDNSSSLMRLEGTNWVHLQIDEELDIISFQNSGGTLTLYSTEFWNYVAIKLVRPD